MCDSPDTDAIFFKRYLPFSMKFVNATKQNKNLLFCKTSLHDTLSFLIPKALLVRVLCFLPQLGTAIELNNLHFSG